MVRENKNLILRSDSYKFSHAFAYNKDVVSVYSYLESRGGEFKELIFFSLQYYLKKYLVGVVITMEDIDEAEKFCLGHFGRKDVFNRAGWEHIVKKHGGKLPLLIKAVPEGSRIPVGNVLMTIENTGGKETRWLTNFVETLLLKVWYPITVATQSNHIKDTIKHYMIKTGGDLNNLPFKCHDFGYRGVTSEEHAALGAAAHLISFMGTDTVAGITLLKDYYGEEMAGFSIPATEHSIMCSFGKENEVEACENFLDQFPEGTIACVSDTYNIFNACENIWGGILREKVLARKGTLVIRPDSGDYLDIIPRLLEILWSKFGGTTNGRYLLLDSHVRLIQGDGMNPKTIAALYEKLELHGWSADNLAVGSGGGLLVEGITRDKQKFAIKASAVQLLNGEWMGIQKTPITDSGKRSKMGRLKLILRHNVYYTVNENEPGEDLLVPVFLNGELLVDYTLEEIRKRANQ